MALIICPECGRQVSDKADVCVHCGYPIKEHVNDEALYKVNLIKLTHSDNRISTQICIEKYGEYESWDAYELIKKAPSLIVDGLHKDEAMYVVYDLQRNGSIAVIEKSETQTVNSEIESKIHEYMAKRPLDGKLRCPKCNSDNIATGQRGFSMITGFIGSNKTVNRCASCGYKWQPK